MVLKRLLDMEFYEIRCKYRKNNRSKLIYYRRMQIDKKNYFFKKKVLITGGTGMIGMELSRMLMLLGAQVSVVSLDKIKYFNEIKYYRKDLTNICKLFSNV